MNDPEIIEKLDEIRQELSGIKHEVNWIANATKRRPTMNELEEIKWELSGIKQEISKIDGHFSAIPISFGICRRALLHYSSGDSLD